jgi:hypothetical protein
MRPIFSHLRCRPGLEHRDNTLNISRCVPGSHAMHVVKSDGARVQSETKFGTCPRESQADGPTTGLIKPCRQILQVLFCFAPKSIVVWIMRI